MRNRFNGTRRGRRPDSFGSVPGGSSPYDFTVRDEDGVEDPVDMLSIRADDELLDALASGLSFTGSDGRHALGDEGLDDNINDDQQMLALLASWRDEIRDTPVGELISVEDASKAIVAGHRSEYPRRRLMSVAAAAAVVVVGMSAVALGAGSAKPGDTLWGVSKALNSDRASSVEAAQQVGVTLASVRQALAEGHVAEAQAKLASIAPVLNKVTDEETKTELSDTQANLTQTVETAKEGEKVKTDDSGKRDDGRDSDSDHGSGHDADHRPDQHGGQNGHDPRSDGSGSRSDQPNPQDALRSEVQKSVDPRFAPGRPGEQKPGDPKTETSTAPDTTGSGPEGHGPGSAGQADPRRTTTAPSTTDSKPTTKPQSGPRPSKWNQPPHRTTTGPGDNGGGGGNRGGGGNGNGGGGGNSQQGQNKPEGQHKAEGEGEPAVTGAQGQPAQPNPAPPVAPGS